MKRQSLLVSLVSLLVFLSLLLAACAPAAPTGDGSEGAVDDGDIIEVTYTYARVPQPDQQLVEDALNEIIIPEIGVRLRLEPIDPGVYNDKMQLRLASGEECDIIFTAPWINSYANNVANGVLHPLDDLLRSHAPGLWNSMPESTWEAARVRGHIYGVINQQIFPKPWGVHVRTDLLDKYDFSLDDVTTFEDMETFLDAVKGGEGITPVLGNNLWRTQYWGYDPLDDGIPAIGLKADDQSYTVVSFMETDEFQQSAETTKRWYDNGWLPLEELPRDEQQALFRAGQFAMGYHVEKPGNDVESKNAFGFDFTIKNLTDPLIIDTAGTTATLNAICATSPNPEAAMQILELFNTDAEVYNTLERGIEGTHWIWEDEANLVMRFPDGVTADTSTYNPNGDWMFGNQFNAYYRDAAQVGAWEATKLMNDTAFPSVALGFVVDRQPIETEVAQVNAVWKELVEPIMNGWVAWEDGAPEAIAKLEEAGLFTIIAEVEQQLKDWKASNE
ncbi:ABC transporter substrate-binding protein [Chloroflexi bacterium TSY]|nr:ABC transporter substrate-binding protein [Chloroflexi bacterium TSY]